MADISHQYGGDIAFGPSGDLQLVGGSDATVQTIIRRLLTNQYDYIWHVDYGTGIGRYVGQVQDADQLQAAILDQMLDEQAVAQDPPPQVTVDARPNGSVYVTIAYADDVTGQPLSIQFVVSA